MNEVERKKYGISQDDVRAWKGKRNVHLLLNMLYRSVNNVLFF